MYKLYKDKNDGKDIVSFAWYKHILHNDFNIKRKKLKKDMYNKCDELRLKKKIANNNKNNKERYKEEREKHQTEVKLTKK